MKLAVHAQTTSARRGLRRSLRAFSILEVITAVFVLTFVLTSSLTVLVSGYEMIDTARYSTLAGQILQSQMEKLRLLTWSQLTGAGGPMGNTTFTPDLVGTSNQAKNFVCTQSIANDPTYANTVDITLTATWTGGDGKTRSRVYYTQYAQNGISDFFYTVH